LNNVPGTVKGLIYGGGSQITAQVIGVVVNLVFVFGVMFVFFKLLDRIIPLRVSEEVEFEGLDQSEVAVTAYPDFNIAKTRR
jgi:Amt family ammonium transporter